MGNLIRRRARRREDAAQHQVLDVDPLRLAGRNLAPGCAEAFAGDLKYLADWLTLAFPVRGD